MNNKKSSTPATSNQHRAARCHAEWENPELWARNCLLRIVPALEVLTEECEGGAREECADSGPFGEVYFELANAIDKILDDLSNAFEAARPLYSLARQEMLKEKKGGPSPAK